jgi:hypothetical protein
LIGIQAYEPTEVSEKSKWRNETTYIKPSFQHLNRPTNTMVASAKN